MARTSSTNSSNLSSKIGGTLFGGIFFAFGFGFFLAFIGTALSDRVAMQNWQPLQATLTNVKLERNYSDGSTTYKATATYQFHYQGQNYHGNRVSLHAGSDNIGGYQNDMHNRLKRAFSSNRPVTVWVNPTNPFESVIDRSVRWSMIIFPGLLCSVFMIIGGVIVYYSWKKKAEADPATVSTTPWLAKEEWSPTGINSNNKMVLGLWWFGALFVNTISSPILFQMPKALSRGEYGILVGLLFVAIGFFLIYKAIQKTLEQQRFGRVPVILSPFPGQIGGRVAGHLDFQQQLDKTSKFKLSLKQMRTVVSRSGNKTTTSTSSVWELNGQGTLKSGINASRVYFAFEVPESMEESRTDDGSGYWWSLEVHGDMPGIDFKRSYEIPVFNTVSRAEDSSASSSSSVVLSTNVSSSSSSQPSDVVTAKPQTDFSNQLENFLDIQQLADGILIKQAAGKQKMAVPTAIFGFLFGAIGIGIGFTGAPLIFPIVFSAFGFLFGAIGINMLITGYETYIDQVGISHKVFRLGKERKHLVWSKEGLLGLCLKEGGSSSSGAKTTEYFDILLQNADGEKINISNGIEGRQAANQLLDSLHMLTGITINKEYKSRLQLKKEQMNRE
ncbi:hypothetical protein R50073_47200 [Maricurvus nonylphenolicus]|uniref:DUF3592 domain-containing protein n=1 Tax=Maricurvus nonylphenolicus TaxID=1008307 RepID=UPI0036F4411F